MSIALIVTRGFGNGTLSSTIKDAVTIGYTIGAAIISEDLKIGITGIIEDTFGVNSKIEENLGISSSIGNL